jgi:hypothetical protein
MTRDRTHQQLFKVGLRGRRLRSAPFLSPCRLWFADNGHINVRCWSSDVHSLAFSESGLGVAQRSSFRIWHRRLHDSTTRRPHLSKEMRK